MDKPIDSAQDKHTETKWHINPFYTGWVADENDVNLFHTKPDRARFIIKACNNYEKLVEALVAIKANFVNELRIQGKTFGYGMFIRELHVKQYTDAINELLSQIKDGE